MWLITHNTRFLDAQRDIVGWAKPRKGDEMLSIRCRDGTATKAQPVPKGLAAMKVALSSSPENGAGT